MTVTYLTLDDIDPHWRASGRWRLGAAPGEPGAMLLPVDEIFVHHTVTPDTGDVTVDVATVCDTDQARFGKVSYSWNVHRSSSSIVEAEGLHRGAHTINNDQQSLNGISFGVGVIGNYHSLAPNPPPTTPDDELIELVALTIVERIIKPGHALATATIKGHKDAPYATACCGDMLYARLPDVRARVAAMLAAPTTEGLNMPAAFNYKTDLDAVWVSDAGELLTRWFSKGQWNRLSLDSRAKPGATPTVVPDALGQPGRLDVFVEAKVSTQVPGGLVHAWFSNETGVWKWASEVLS